MATLSQNAVVRPLPSGHRAERAGGPVFLFRMSLLTAAIVVWGFNHTVNDHLFHPAVPRPLLLWFHGAAFSGWVAFFIFQSALVSTGNVKRHRLLRLVWRGTGHGDGAPGHRRRRS